ncbi:MAG TPA: oligosaccharide flippase family protein [Azospirillum sp.]
MSNEGRTIRAIRITLVANGVSAVAQIGIMVVLARLVASEDYGLVAGALALVRPVQYLLTGGAERAILLLPGLSQEGIDSAFWAVMTAAAVASLVLAALVPPSVRLGVPEDFAAVVLALVPLLAIGAAGTVFRGVLRRRFAFGGLVIADLAGQILGTGAVAILAAAAGWGASALVAGLLAQALLQTGIAAAIAIHSAGLRIRPRIDRAALRPIVAASVSMSKTSMLEVLNGQLPPAIIGPLLGAHALGLYNRAASLVQVPVEMIVTSLTRVQISDIGALRDSPAELRRTCGTLTETVGAVVLPLCGGMMLAAPELVAVVLGAGWADAAEAVSWTCLAVAAFMVGHVFAVVNEGTLRLDERFRIQVITMLLAGAGLALGAGVGFDAALAGWAFSAIAFMALHMRLMARVLQVPVGDVLARLVPGTVAAVACMAGVAGLSLALPSDTGPALRLCLDIAVCGSCVVLIYATLFPSVFATLLRYGGLRRLPASAPVAKEG